MLLWGQALLFMLMIPHFCLSRVAECSVSKEKSLNLVLNNAWNTKILLLINSTLDCSLWGECCVSGLNASGDWNAENACARRSTVFLNDSQHGKETSIILIS